MAGSVCINMDFAALPGAIMEEKLAHAQKNVPVLVFGKEHCSFTLEVRRTFDSLSVPFTLYNVDAIPDGAKVHNLLKESTKQATVPYVYIGGDLIGGCDATKAAQHNGTLAKKLAAVGIYPKGLSGAKPIEFALPEDSRRPLTTLVAFPEVVDERVARFAGVWAFIVCLLVAVFWWTPQAKWTMCGLMVDFVLRFLGGGNISPLGALSTLCVGVMEWFGSKPRWVSGQAKQFATLCGIMFSTLAFFFYIVSIHEDKLDKVGLAFTCALGVATGLEGFVGFCLGCWMFGLMIRFGVLPEDTYRVYTNVVDEAAATWEDMNKRLNEGEPAKHRRLIRSDGIPSDIDYKYKAKTDDMTKEDFHIIKHVKITHFYMHMGITGLACAWKAASPYASLYAPTAVEYAVALLAAVLFVAFLFLYAMKMIKYPHKVAKEWQCPVRGNAFAVPFIVSMLFAYIVDQHSHRFGMVLFWIGAPITMALGIKRMANWISRRVDFEHINASWMVAPVGNAVAALVGPYIEVGHTNACQFWWAVAFISWTLLFTITFYKHVINVDEDDRMRPLVAIWVAAPAVLAVSYLQVYPVIVVSGEIFNDFIFINLHWIAVGIALCLVYTFSPMAGAFSGRMRFDMAYWAAGFPAAALSLCTTTYNLVKPGNLSYGIAIAGLATATVVNLVLCINTLSALVRRRVFVPDAKWGPLSFMRLTHEALRGAIDNMLKLAELMSSSQTVSPDLVADVNESWKMMALVHDEHSKHEDQVIFKLYDEFFPGIANDWNDQHNHHHEIMKNIDEILVTLTKNPSCEAAKQLESALQEYAKELELHLRGEEDHLIGLPRKYINLNLHKQTIRKVWDITAVPNWFKILPWVVNNLPYLHQRVRFLKTIIWALPERSQHIGMMVGLGVDAVQWRRVTDELPDIIPRGAPGPYKRYY